MKLIPILANISRLIARITALPAVLLIFFYLLFGMGYAMTIGTGAQNILAYVIPLVGVSIGLILAYWEEKIGTIVSFVSFLALFIMIGTFVSLEDMLDDFSTFIILIVPIGLFYASWLLRRNT